MSPRAFATRSLARQAATTPLTRSVFQLVLLVTLLRAGLLAGVAMGWTVSLLSNAPLTADVDAWYWPRALLVLLIVAGGAAWAAWTAASPRTAVR